MFERYCTKDYSNSRKLLPFGHSGGIDDECGKEGFTNTMKDIYGFHDITHKLNENTSDKDIRLPEDLIINGVPLPSDSGGFNQLLSKNKLPFQYSNRQSTIENPGFSKYWKEFGPKPSKQQQITENFCVNPLNVRSTSNECKMSIQNLENQSVKTYEHYTNRLKEPVNFNTYKPLAYHAGITDSDLLPKNYGVLHHQYLDRFKYNSPLSDISPEYEMPYEFKKNTAYDLKKDNYNEFLKENFVDGKVKQNHREFVKQLKEKNINGNKAKEHSIMSGDSNLCGSVLARDCFSNLGTCGGSSYGKGISSGEAYIQHKKFCSDYCSPVAHCLDTP